jgi:mannosylglycerate hydrolase
LTPDRKARSGRLLTLPVFFYITLKKDSPLIYITAKIDNQIKDHRLRAVFRGPKNDFVYVQTQGDVVKRRIEEGKAYPRSRKRDITHNTSIGALPKEAGPSPTQFQRNFVGINDGTKGLVIFNKGLPEYEASPDGTIALTLLRSVGWLSQDDLNSRQRLAGPKIPVPDAQCIGEHILEYAIVTQSGSWNASPLYREENQYSIPLKNMIIHRQEGAFPSKLSFLKIKPDELMVSAVKKAYSDNDLIIRLFNPTGKFLKGRVGILHGIKQAWLADLNEEKKKKIPVRKDGMAFVEVGPKKIVTVRLNQKPSANAEDLDSRIRGIKGSRKKKN